VPKVHNKPIQVKRKRSNKGNKRQPRAALVWRTGQCPVHQRIQLQTCQSREFWRPLRYNSPDCPVSQRSNGYFSTNGRLQPHWMRYSARQRQSSARRRTRQSTGPVRCTTGLSGGPEDRSSNGRTLTVGWRGWRTGLSGAPCDRQPPNEHFWWVGL
jgi:hypothetical protein